MTATAPAPAGAEYFLDVRGDARSMRVRWHDAAGIAVISLWRGAECTGTFRLAADDVPAFLEALRVRVDSSNHATTR